MKRWEEEKPVSSFNQLSRACPVTAFPTRRPTPQPEHPRAAGLELLFCRPNQEFYGDRMCFVPWGGARRGEEEGRGGKVCLSSEAGSRAEPPGTPGPQPRCPFSLPGDRQLLPADEYFTSSFPWGAEFR